MMFSKVSQAEKAKLEYYAKLYADGLLDPDFLTNTWDVMEQKFYEGKAAVLAETASSVIQVYNTKMVSTNGGQMRSWLYCLRQKENLSHIPPLT